jgi:hypothetical protein
MHSWQGFKGRAQHCRCAPCSLQQSRWGCCAGWWLTSGAPPNIVSTNTTSTSIADHITLLLCCRRASRSVGYLQTTHWGTLGARSSCSTAAARDAPPSCLSDQGAAEQPRTVRKAPGPSLSPEQSRAVTCSVQHLLQAVAGPWDAQAVHQQLQVLAKLAHMEEAGQHIVQQRGAGCVADAMARAASVAAAATSPAGGGDGLKPSTQEAEQHVVLEVRTPPGIAANLFDMPRAATARYRSVV